MMTKYFLFTLIIGFLCTPLLKAQQQPRLHHTKYGNDSIAGKYIQMRYYYLYANTVDDLNKAIKEMQEKTPNRKHYLASTRTEVKWNWDGFGSTDCNLASLKLNPTIIITFPRWEMPTYIPNEVKKKWDDFIRKLAEHEIGHIEVALNELPLMEKRIKSASCMSANGNAKAAMEEMKQANIRYDDATWHGYLQGAKF